MADYYNEFDPYAAQWLRNLIAAGHLPPGDVDERSIVDIAPEDLNGYDQCHFFAGIGVWPYALHRAGLGGRAGLWTGSCPCQPFSAAGRQLGFDDERHLWPAWFHLITQRRPAIVVGEQVASALAWLDLVRDDLESAGYAVGAADLCAPGFPMEDWGESPQHEWLLRAIYDCPDPLVAAELLDFAAFASGNLGAHDGDHIRQRLYFVGVAEPDGRQRDRQPSGERCERNGASTGWVQGNCGAQSSGAVGRLADGAPDRRGEECAHGGGGRSGNAPQGRPAGFEPGSHTSGVGDADDSRLEGLGGDGSGGHEPEPHEPQPDGPHYHAGGAGRPARAAGEQRRDADWLRCRDGRWRPVEPGTFPLADAPAARMGRLRAYGNALDAGTVTAFLDAVRECLP